MIEIDRVFRLSNKFSEWGALQSRDSYQRRNLCYRVRAFIVLLYLGYEQIRDYRYPEVRTDSILRVSPHGLDNNVLLNPFEEDLYIPSVPIQVSDLQCTDVEVVADEYDFIFSLLVIVTYGSYRYSDIVFACVKRMMKSPVMPASLSVSFKLLWPIISYFIFDLGLLIQ